MTESATASVLATMVAISLCACSPKVAPAANTKVAVDKDLLTDKALAIRELERRLAASVSVHDGFMLVRDPSIGDLDLAIMPTNTPWILHCGAGIWLAFAGGGDEGDSGVTVSLSEAIIDKATCDSIGPRLAGDVERLLGKRSPKDEGHGNDASTPP